MSHVSPCDAGRVASETCTAAAVLRRRRSIAHHLLARVLRRLDVGSLTVELPTGERIEHRGRRPGTAATWILHRWRPLWRVLWRGDLGFAESYMDGDWSTPDLPALLTLFSENDTGLADVYAGLRTERLVDRLRHRKRANTKRGSRRNIAAHYDLGNAFYAAWLDRSMTYSSAIYTAGTQSLEDAQREKLDRIVALLGLAGGEHVLEIGCGWGALAARMAEAGCRVTGLTLSSEQLALARQRLAAAGHGTACDLRLQDYRDVDGTFDRIVSIEMIEAVGEKYWPVYFETLFARLKAGGSAVIQAITIEASRFDSYRRNPDFIQRYVFPGGMLPTRAMMIEHARRAGLVPTDETAFGQSYARTLAEWRHRFLAAWPAIEPHGFDRRFRRMWEYYLAYCETGFRLGVIDVGLFRFAKPTSA
ncbi:cyclopropane-fatty-acyl-phospholipid synthase [Rhodoplanes sp. TEM]|uniref:Cyclopropane-fatty-acyl-phospholipid synthase n=1 Tax=Rhodoplanes tepidamans TaxID=200616 RepID=A0ABT5JH29_RHOTP|nr:MULTISPECIES: cyclopropane-fatty-acyl-phospholipid synthase family protein [Rhodoplanes]MDC7788599.1 cyclopropane-fatty-acyl-phospholipid synthase [Rhodoplanes tepidamans]MDC7986855.1 cyclopropane-fatty-acyl-phospholipid synthase [Rhodoplanes sp. TEM]MDQ0358582.1 cyclopropane-fatty-acyl-phospholipid synthase [Rhodoplanes tepidamans]